MEHLTDRHEPHYVTVNVFAPRSAEPKAFTWPLSITVGQAAKEAAVAFGYEGGDPTLGLSDGEPFKRDETLKAEHVHEKEDLELLDVGGGV